MAQEGGASALRIFHIKLPQFSPFLDIPRRIAQERVPTVGSATPDRTALARQNQVSVLDPDVAHRPIHLQLVPDREHFFDKGYGDDLQLA